jgi:3-hydroxyacyl-CoA dehydrogenase
LKRIDKLAEGTDMATVHYSLRDSIAVIEFSNLPANTFNHILRRDVMAVVERANLDSKARAIVLFGAGGNFSAGADVHELGIMQSARGPGLPELVRAVESSSKPVVAAIEGDCLGGGLQLTLGCHYRVAHQDARLGLPEVKLGLLPCAGGTQRLPRLCGLSIALKMIVSGEIMSAAELQQTPLLDEVVAADTLDAAVNFAATVVKQGRDLPRTRDRPVNDRNAKLIFDQARIRAKESAKGLIAPLRAIDAVEAAITQTFDEGIRAERFLFKQLYEGAESRALRHVFLAKRVAGKIADIPDSTPTRTIERAAVVGAGFVGISIAMSFMDVGIPVSLLEVGEEALERSCARIHDHYETLVKRGKLTKQQCDERLELLTPSDTYSSIASADIVVEAVFEELAIKQHVFATLDRTMKPGAILATNTSTLDVNRIARATKRPGDVVGFHFLSPPRSMKLIEIVRGEATSDDVLTTAVKLAKRLKKAAVVSRSRDGFIGNRMLAQFLEQALLLVEEGASPYAIDAATENFGFEMGPFRSCDLAGTDIHWLLRRQRRSEHADREDSTLDDDLCELGRTGKSANAGWYDYKPGDSTSYPSPTVAEMIRKHRARKGVKAREIEEPEIVDRLVLTLVNEGSRILEERTAERASDVDLVLVSGYGFPKWRGGPLFHADLIGLDRVVKRMKDFEANPLAKPESWQSTFLLQRLAAEAKTFRSLDRPFSL